MKTSDPQSATPPRRIRRMGLFASPPPPFRVADAADAISRSAELPNLRRRTPEFAGQARLVSDGVLRPQADPPAARRPGGHSVSGGLGRLGPVYCRGPEAVPDPIRRQRFRPPQRCPQTLAGGAARNSIPLPGHIRLAERWAGSGQNPIIAVDRLSQRSVGDARGGPFAAPPRRARAAGPGGDPSALPGARIRQAPRVSG